MLTIGDVCGKGSAAAALTGLVRHTAHVAGRFDPDPRTVLSAVNTAILDDRPAHPFCTAAHARLALTDRASGGAAVGEPASPAARPGPDRDPGPVLAAARSHLALGGHPRPLVRRADGSLTALGTPGTLLGIIDEPRLHLTEHALHPRRPAAPVHRRRHRTP